MEQYPAIPPKSCQDGECFAELDFAFVLRERIRELSYELAACVGQYFTFQLIIQQTKSMRKAVGELLSNLGRRRRPSLLSYPLRARGLSGDHGRPRTTPKRRLCLRRIHLPYWICLPGLQKCQSYPAIQHGENDHRAVLHESDRRLSGTSFIYIP